MTELVTIQKDQQRIKFGEEEEDDFLPEFNKKVVKLFRDAFWKTQSIGYGAFLLKTIRNQKKAAKRRAKYKQIGIQVPAFLIYSVTHRCNLRCKGCYAAAFNELNGTSHKELDLLNMERILTEANEAGSSIILLAGGEPFVRKQELFYLAARFPQLIFPVFTNGTMINEEIIQNLKKHRNIIPVLSIEGHIFETDSRRGDGVYQKILSVMKMLNQNRIFFGNSITLTRKNFNLVTNPEFVEEYINYLFNYYRYRFNSIKSL